MASVLAAEQSARISIDATRTHAAGIVEQARADARALAERTQRRVVKVRAAFARQAQADVAALEAQGRALAGEHQPDAAEQQRLSRAVSALAERLTTTPP